MKIYNKNSTGQQWNLTTGIVGQENTSFCIRDATNNVNAFTMAKTSGNATFAGTVETTTLRTDVVNNKANSANIIYRSGTDTIIGGGSASQKLTIADTGNATFAGLVNIPAYADGNKFTITSSAGSSHNIIEMGQLGSDGFLDVSASGGAVVSHLSGYTGYASYFLSSVGIGTD